MKKYAVIIERGPSNMSAYVPDLPGCITTGMSVEEIARNIREAIELHLEGMAEDGEAIPETGTRALEIEVPSDGAWGWGWGGSEVTDGRALPGASALLVPGACRDFRVLKAW